MTKGKISYSTNYTPVKLQFFNSNYHFDSILEEYKTLRTEIMNRQEARVKTLQFTIAAVGAIVGVIGLFMRFLIVDVSVAQPDFIYLSSCLMLILSILAIIIIVSATYLTQANSKQTLIIASYIKKYIEKDLLYLNWETRYNKYYEKNLTSDKFKGPFGTNKSFLIFYLLLTLTFVLLVSFLTIKMGTDVFLMLVFILASGFSIFYILWNILYSPYSDDYWKNIP